MKTLKAAAKELASISTAVTQPRVPVEVPDVKSFLKTAVERLRFTGAVEPEALAKDVSQVSGQKVTAQTLSKGLKKLGITATKHKGRRVFKPSTAERTNALRKLGA